MAPEDEVDALLAAVGHSLEDDLATVAAQARSLRRWSRQQSAESSTFGGVLLSLAEREGPVTVRCGPWVHRGRLRSVTEGLVIIEVPGAVALLNTTAITMVEAATMIADDRPLGPGYDLGAVLATLAAERAQVRLLVGDGTELAGTLLEVGYDIACVGRDSSVATVRLQALAGCLLEARCEPQADGSGSDLGSLDDFGSG